MVNSISTFGFGDGPPAGEQTTVVLLVRHADRAAGPGDDPPLNAEGHRRAEALVAAIGHARPSAIITTQTRRTIETALPSAVAFGVEPQQVPIDPQNIEQNVAAVAAAVRSHSGQ